jgi:hypothetical protein
MTIMSMSLKPTTTTTPTATGTGTTSGVAVTVDYAHHVRQATTTDVTEYPVGGEDEAGPAPDTRLLSDLGKSHGEVLVQTRVEVEGDKRHSAGRAQEPVS